jgi:hypothetical protein
LILRHLLGYINGTKGMQINKASVAGYLGMPFHGDKKSLEYYDQGIWLRTFVKCDALEPIGTLPAHTNDNYIHFYIGFHDGSTLRDNSDPSGNSTLGTCPSGHSTEYCAGYSFGWNNDESVINPPSPVNCPGSDKASADFTQVQRDLGELK